MRRVGTLTICQAGEFSIERCNPRAGTDQLARQCPHPGRPHGRRVYLQDASDNSAIGQHVVIVIVPLAGGRLPWRNTTAGAIGGLRHRQQSNHWRAAFLGTVGLLGSSRVSRQPTVRRVRFGSVQHQLRRIRSLGSFFEPDLLKK